MNKPGCVLAIMLFSICATAAPVIDTPYTIGTWRGFASAAISWTFDDGLANQYSVVMPLFDAKGFKMTFYTVVTGSMFPGWAKDDTAFKHGHEIASHSMTHPQSIGSLSSTQMTYELKNSKDSIVKHVPGEQCIDHAYPNCNTAPDSVMRKYYAAARICSGQIVPKTPTNFFQISCFICGTQSSNQTTANFNTIANNAASSNGWAVYLVHAVNSESGYSPTQSSAIQGHLAYLDTTRSKFWVQTFGNVVRYIKERNASSVRVLTKSADTITLSVTDTLNDTIFNFPITIRRPLPEGWAAVTVTQKGVAMSTKYKDSGSTHFLIFDAVPDGGTITVARATATALLPDGHVRPGRTAATFEARLTRAGLAYVAPAGSPAKLDIGIFDCRGMCLGRFRTTGSSGCLHLPALRHGVYFVRATDNRSRWSTQVIAP